MPDQEPRTGGVRLRLYAGQWIVPTVLGYHTHIAREVPEDEARDAVIAAARNVMLGGSVLRIKTALDRLAALQSKESPS